MDSKTELNMVGIGVCAAGTCASCDCDKLRHDVANLQEMVKYLLESVHAHVLLDDVIALYYSEECDLLLAKLEIE